MANSIALIIPAAGSGSRLQTDIPKPFLKIGGRSVLEHTASRFTGMPNLSKIIVPTSVAYMQQVENMLAGRIPDSIELVVVEGGKERQDSIFNALQQVGEATLVIVHDAVRPFVEPSHIKACCEAAAETGAAVLGVPAKDTIKRIDEIQTVLETPERKEMWQAQTPQVFRKTVLMDAYTKAVNDNFIGTDDASLVERMGQTVKMVEGDYRNFKITFPLDLALAKLLLEKE